MTKDLKPCPFCGCEHVMILPPTCKRGDAYDPADRAMPLARCMDCYAETLGVNWDATCDSAYKAWNTRAALSGSPQIEAGTKPVPFAWAIDPNDGGTDLIFTTIGHLAASSRLRYPNAQVKPLYTRPENRPREQEGGEAPVAWLTEGDDGDVGLSQTKPAPHYFSMPKYRVTPLFAHPPLPADGWKEGIEAAAKVAEDDADDRVGIAGHRIALKIRALLTTPTEGGADADH